jgi:hypothetical protein
MYGAGLAFKTIECALSILQAVSPSDRVVLTEVDAALHVLLKSNSYDIALNCLTKYLSKEKYSVEDFDISVNFLMSGDCQKLFDVVASWLISENYHLCVNAERMFGIETEDPFRDCIASSVLDAKQQVFLCQKAVGFFFLKPILCCSIILAVLRCKNQEIASVIGEILFDNILLNYGGEALEYLRGISSKDAAYEVIQTVIEKDISYKAALDAVGTIKELYPSDYHRNVVRQHTRDEMQTAMRRAEDNSIIRKFVRRYTVLYGKSTVTHVMGGDGGRRAVSMDMKSLSVSFELPRLEILDPVGLNCVLRMLRVGRMK